MLKHAKKIHKANEAQQAEEAKIRQEMQEREEAARKKQNLLDEQKATDEVRLALRMDILQSPTATKKLTPCINKDPSFSTHEDHTLD